MSLIVYMLFNITSEIYYFLLKKIFIEEYKIVFLKNIL